MSIIIHGMDMPECCGDCRFLDDSGDYPYCTASGKQKGYTFIPKMHLCRMDSCPLVELPPHGRLIDADALTHEYYKNPSYPNLCNALNNAQTIIEAEGVKE